MVANRYPVGGSHCGGVRASVLAFGFIGLSGFVPNLATLWLLSISLGMNNLLAEVAANQGAITWNFLLLANSDLVARVALLGLLVAHAHLNVLVATAITLIATFGARFVATGRLPAWRGLGGAQARSRKL